jgi:hypothetical protein
MYETIIAEQFKQEPDGKLGSGESKDSNET